MENFIVDLDKVLDDFESNEDEHESNAHYDRLQLEFQRENVRTNATHSAQFPASLAPVGGWNEPVNNIPTEDRGLPDGQHDDTKADSACRQSLVSIAEREFDISSCAPQSCISDGSNALLSVSNEEKNIVTDDIYFSLPTSRPDVTSDLKSDGENLWPNLSTQNSLLQDIPSVDTSASKLLTNASLHRDDLSYAQASKFEDIGASSFLNQSAIRCPLDVIPSDIPSVTGSLVSNEGHHPDILGTSQSLQDENSPYKLSFDADSCLIAEKEDTREANSLLSSQGDHMLPESPDIQKELCLLPDLMPGSNISSEGMSMDISQMSETCNPAVVTENSLYSLGRSDEPAIVQESQSNSRIPEVVNVHQLMEQTSNQSPHHFIDLSPIDSQVTTGSQYQNKISSEFQQISGFSSVQVLPDVSASCQSSQANDNLAKYPENTLNPNNYQESCAVKFNPSANINDDELDAELEELEEEQMRLQGTCSGLETHQDVISCEVDKVKSLQTCEFDKRVEVDAKCLNEEKENILHASESNTRRFLNCTINEPIGQAEASVDSQAHAQEHPASNVISSDQALRSDFNSPGIVASIPMNSNGTDMQDGSNDINEGNENAVHNNPVSVYGTAEVPDPAQIPASSFTHTSAFAQASAHEPPGTLVTAVYDDTGIKDDPSEESTRDCERGLSGVGVVAPFWIPDEDAPNCQECGVKFTVLKRRHHCRGCGRVLCAPCCHFKAPLPYMDFKEARVCGTCLHLLTEAERDEDRAQSRPSNRSANPNNPMDYCSRIPPQQQVGTVSSGSPPVVMVPVSVLKRDTCNSGNSSSSRPRGSKQVIFSDGIRPGGDLTELGGQTRPSSPYRNSGRSTRHIVPNIPGNNHVGGVNNCTRGMNLQNELEQFKSLVPNTYLFPSGGGLPPFLMKASAKREYSYDSTPDNAHLEGQLKEDGDPVVFALQKNLTVLAKQIKLDCCVGLDVWNISTRGLCNVGQEELVILLKVSPGEKTPPPHLFSFIHTVYQQANKGNLVTEMGHTIFTEPEGFLGSKDNGGFLYIRPSYQCLNKLILPPSPYLFAILIQKWETPWAKVFPLRLMLRLGAEFRYYPCPLISTRNRKSVYSEIGHTIMNLLVDFRNYAYTIPVIQGFYIHMEDKKTTLIIPRNRYEQIWKALNSSNDHLLSLGANFSSQADSHLVTAEDDDGHYSTQAINIQGKPRKVTGASFIVFNGALKSNAGLRAKSSIVEDGIMVQIAGEIMTSLRDALRNMKDFDIPCGPTKSQPDELVLIRWIQDDKNFNIGIKSPIDGRHMDGIPSVKIHSDTDYVNNDYLIRWTEVFIIQGEPSTGNNDINISRLAECLARACCVALTPHLELLYDKGPTRLGLRATIHQDNVGYEAGMGEARLLPHCMNELDAALVPVIHRAATNVTEQAVILELVFHIMEH